LEIDVQSFFDSVDRSRLIEMLQKRVADGSILRLIGKCLHVGVLDGAELTTPDEGTTQGSTLSPLLGNVYLHYVLDLWFTKEVLPRLRGKAKLIRFADDAIFGFERQDDAERVMAVLGKRLAAYGLALHPEKTRLLDFRRPPRSQAEGKGPAIFDFLGFTWYWRRTRKGRWAVTCKTRRARLTRAIVAIYDWCRNNRHRPVSEQHEALKSRVQGHFNYFGVNGNIGSLMLLIHHVRRVWHKWLNRRSQRARLTWQRFKDLVQDFPLPTPRVVVEIWR
jgi:RNA-directed DNA polymerase